MSCSTCPRAEWGTLIMCSGGHAGQRQVWIARGIGAGGHAPERGKVTKMVVVEGQQLRPRTATAEHPFYGGATTAELIDLMRAPGTCSVGGSRPFPVETPGVRSVRVDAAIACMLAFNISSPPPSDRRRVSHCQRTRAAALAGLHPEKVHLGLQQQPQLPCAAANLPERERLQREASHDQLSAARASL